MRSEYSIENGNTIVHHFVLLLSLYIWPKILFSLEGMTFENVCFQAFVQNFAQQPKKWGLHGNCCLLQSCNNFFWHHHFWRPYHTWTIMNHCLGANQLSELWLLPQEENLPRGVSRQPHGRPLSSRMSLLPYSFLSFQCLLLTSNLSLSFALI